MVHDRQLEHCRIFDCSAHDFVALYAFSVVRYGDDAGFFQLAGGRELFPVHPDREATGRIDVDHRLACDLVHDPLNRASVVADRAGVGHADHACKSSGCRGAGTAGDLLLVSLPRIAEVDMNVDQSGRDDEAAGIDLGRRFLLRPVNLLHNYTIHGENIADLVTLVGRVDDPSAGYP